MPNTQMPLDVFIFICINILLLFYLIIYRIARDDDKLTYYNIILIGLLIFYNLFSGLLPDKNLPGSLFLQEVIAYGSGFLTAGFLPYYVYKAFHIESMKFHAKKGAFFFIFLPFLAFVFTYAISESLNSAQNILIIPFLYGGWIITSLIKALRKNNKAGKQFLNNETVVILLSITPWVALPVVSFFDLNQSLEAIVTNPGFLMLFALNLKQHIRRTKLEHDELISSQIKLMTWNKTLQNEVNKRTRKLELMNEQRTTTFMNIAHETKTPLTLINSYLDDYIQRKGQTKELTIIQENINVLKRNIINFFDIEKIQKGITVYNHQQTFNLSKLLRNSLVIFEPYLRKRTITTITKITDNIFVRADPSAIQRIITNLIENAIKFSDAGKKIEVRLNDIGGNCFFSVTDEGVGIPINMQKRVFEPYFQINTNSNPGMGLGLPICKKIALQIGGNLIITSKPHQKPGTKISLVLPVCNMNGGMKEVSDINITGGIRPNIPVAPAKTTPKKWESKRKTILIIEDNLQMNEYLSNKLNSFYNIHSHLNGQSALKFLTDARDFPDLIITDVMMDGIDGFKFLEIIRNNNRFNHIPIIFLTAKCSKDDQQKAYCSGAIDYIVKPFTTGQLLTKIKNLLELLENRNKVLANSLLENAFQRPVHAFVESNLESPPPDEKLLTLSRREGEVAELIVEGFTRPQIANKLIISERTVAKHIENLYKKLEVKNKLQLTKMYMKT